ncbi:MAG: M1 family metallopeptidase [Candidatus Ranarchaeia archaeon]
MVEVNPKHYKVHLEPNLQTFKVHGTTEIVIESDSAISEITVNALELAIWNCEVKDGDKYVKVSFHYDPKPQELQLTLPKAMESPVTIKIEHIGHLNDKLVGFYRSKYTVDGQEKYLGVTQFEETHARQAFPCYDHPGKKSTFDIEFVIDEDLIGVANTPIQSEEKLDNGKKLVKFETTPKMCAYLLFFGVGDFEILEDKSDPVVQRVLTTPGNTKYGKFGLEFSKKVLKFGEDYTGVKYPLKKMDQIAVPDFAFGAMENYGAITYRENLLLVYPGITSKAGLERIAEVIAHEWAHQWFGNLVSPLDWKYLWLNESFATLFGYAITDHYYPEWQIWDQFMWNETNGAFERDSLIETFPIELPGEGEQIKINPATAPIIYNKGASVLQMMRGYLGEANFKKGIGFFLKKYAFGNANSDDYWSAFDEATGNPISEMMEGWIHHPGYPVLEVNRKGAEVQVKQRRFSFLPNTSEQLWLIPITLIYYTSDGTSHTQKALFEGETMTLTIPEDAVAFKINPEQTGFYRVSYEKHTLEALGKLVEDKTLSPKDRYGIQTDMFAMVREGSYSVDEYLAFLSYYTNEDAYLPLVDIARNLIHIFSVLKPKREKISAVGRKIFAQVFEKLGYEPKEEDLHITSILRSTLLWPSYLFGDEGVVKFGKQKFEDLKKKREVHADILANVMRMGAAGDKASFDWFTKKLESPETNEQEKINILRALGNFSDKDTVFKALDYTLEKVPLGNQYIPIIFAIRNLNSVDHVWSWYQKNLSKIEKLHYMHHGYLIGGILEFGAFGKEAEVKSFFKDYMVKNELVKDTIKMGLEQLEVNSRLRQR